MMKFQTTLVSLCTVLSLSTLSYALADTDIYAPFPEPTNSCTMPPEGSTDHYCNPSNDYPDGCYLDVYAVPGCKAIEGVDPYITDGTCKPDFIAGSACTFTPDYQCEIQLEDCGKLDTNEYPDLNCNTVHDTCEEQVRAYQSYCCTH